MSWATPKIDWNAALGFDYVAANRIEANVKWLAGGNDNIAQSTDAATAYALAKRDSAGSISFNAIAAASVSVSGALSAATFNGATIVAGAISGASLAVSGALSGASLAVSGAVSAASYGGAGIAAFATAAQGAKADNSMQLNADCGWAQGQKVLPSGGTFIFMRYTSTGDILSGIVAGGSTIGTVGTWVLYWRNT